MRHRARGPGEAGIGPCRPPLVCPHTHTVVVSGIFHPFRRSHIFAVVGGMMVISGDVAINGRGSGSSGATRAYPPWTKRPTLRFPIGFVFAEDPKRRFGQMPGHGPDGLRVTLALRDAVIEATHMAVRRAPARDADRVRGFADRPFEIAVDVWPGRPKRVFPPLAWTRGVVPASAASFSAVANRATLPTSSAITTARMSPRPARS
jgi:hypothetical protein